MSKWPRGATRKPSLEKGQLPPVGGADDLRQLADLRIGALAHNDLREFDLGLMMRNHCRREVAIGAT